jgi:hypothetical protein
LQNGDGNHHRFFYVRKICPSARVAGLLHFTGDFWFRICYLYLPGIAMKHLAIVIMLVASLSCSKIDEFRQPPDLAPLDQGFRTSASIAYCVSLATTLFNGGAVPENVVFTKTTQPGYSGAGLIYVKVSESNPLPFTNKVGDIVIAGLWDGENGGVLSILFADVDILSGETKLFGIHTIPVIRKKDTGKIIAIFAEQDIVVGEGKDTLLTLGLSKIKFDAELDRLNHEQPSDVFVAVTQNVWHLTIDPVSSSYKWDFSYEVTGGGQILSATSTSGGILYHAMINTRFSFRQCRINPVYGTAFIQNLKAGSVLDLGTILLEFHSSCDGKAEVKLATGKYVTSNGKDLHLNLN